MIHRQLSEASRRRLQWLASGIAVVALTAASAGVAAADNYGYGPGGNNNGGGSSGGGGSNSDAWPPTETGWPPSSDSGGGGGNKGGGDSGGGGGDSKSSDSTPIVGASAQPTPSTATLHITNQTTSSSAKPSASDTPIVPTDAPPRITTTTPSPTPPG